MKTRKRKKVYKYKPGGVFIEEYNSIEEAAIKNSINRVSISNCCNSKIAHVNGFTYSFHKNETNYKKTNIIKEDCRICSVSFATKRGLASHIQMCHGISSRQYTKRFIVKRYE